jgi:hypothetical protein
MANGSNPTGGGMSPGNATTDSSITKPPQIALIVAAAAAVGGAVGALVGSLIGAG